MERMRLILIVAGVALLLAVYLLSRWQYRRRTPPIASSVDDIHDDPLFMDDHGAHPEPHELEQELEGLERLLDADRPASGAPDRTAPVTAAVANEKFVVVHVVAPEGRRFSGTDVRRSLEDEGITFGAMNIFHRMAPAAEGAGNNRSLFSVANLAEPGTFDLDAMDRGEVKGCAFFMRLPGPMDGCSIFNSMLSSAQHVAGMLHGQLRDDTHSPLSPQMIQHLRDDIRGYERQSKIARTAS